MIGFIFFTAITNLCLGCWLGRLLLGLPETGRQSKHMPCESPSPVELPAPTTTVTDPAASVDRPSTNMDVSSVSELSAGGGDAHGPSSPRKTTAWSAPKSLADCDQELRTLQERIKYARTAADKRLAKDVETQLRDLVQSWHSQLGACLSGTSTAEQSKMAIGVDDMDCLEMCLAQLETTGSNIGLLDWAESPAVNLDKLERQAEGLDKLLKTLRRAHAKQVPAIVRVM